MSSESPVAESRESALETGDPSELRWYEDWRLQALLVLMVALGLRATYLAQAAETEYPGQLSFLQDARYYASWSERIADGEWVGKHSFYMGPLYPYSVAAVSALSDVEPILQGEGGAKRYDFEHVFWWQALLGVGSALLALAIGRQLLGAWQGLLAGLLVAAHRVFIYYDGLLMPASQGLFVGLLALWSLLFALRRESWGAWLGAGACLGLATLSKGPFLLMLPGVWLWLLVGFRELSLRERASRAALVAAGCLPLVLLATAHNLAADGDFVLVTSNGGSNLWIGNGPSASGAHAGVSSRFPSAKLDFYAFDQDRPAGEPPASEVSRQLTSDSLSYMSEDLSRSLGLLWKKFRMFWNEVEIGTTDHFYFFAERAPILAWPTPGFGVLVPLGLLGFVLALARWRQWFPLHLLVLTQTLSFTAFFVLGRYRFATVACMILFAVHGLDWFIKGVRERRFAHLSLATFGLLLASLLVHWPVEGMGRERGLANQHFLLAQLPRHRGEPGIELLNAALQADWREGDLSLRQEAVAHMQVGDHLAKSKRFKRASEHYRSAITVCERMSSEFRYRAPLTADLRGRLRLLGGAEIRPPKGAGAQQE